MRILYVDVDSLRPDHLSCYGYGRETSPTIDAVAAEGVRFDRCYASDTPCLPSRTALVTCRFGIDTGVATHFGDGQWYDDPGIGHDPDPDRVPSFRLLAENGLYTASISSFSQRHLAYHFAGSFQETVMPTASAGELAVEDRDDVTPVASNWLRRHAAEEHWFLHVNYWDVHHPYREIANEVDRVRESGPAAPWPDDAAIAAQQGVTGPRTADLWPGPDVYGRDVEGDCLWPMPDRIADREDAEHLVDGYDASIRAVDGEVAKLLAVLEDEGVREETAIVVSADHGEALGEHGIYAEHAFPHPPNQRVPLIVSWPGVTDDAAGTAVDAQVYQFDLMATVCDLVGVDVPAAWHAASFAPALSGEAFDGRDVIISTHGIFTFGRAVYRDDWVYVRLLHPGVFHYPGLYNDPDSLPGRGLELLHHLGRDPHMTENLVASRPDVAAELSGELDAWTTRYLSDQWFEHRPVATRGIDPLAKMASYGPYLYVDPDELLELYRETGRSGSQIAAVERTLESFPRRRWSGTVP